MKAKSVILLLSFTALFLLPALVNGQCAMCSAANESAMENGGGIGLNEGIVYLLGIPYLLLAIMGAVFYRKKIRGFVQDLKEIH